MKKLTRQNPLALKNLLSDISACTLCAEYLPLGPRPVLQASAGARLLIVGQAPGTKVHASGIPWDDASGDRLRQWLKLDKSQFYDADKIAIMPMGLCYPGKGKSGDLPPRLECAPLWHKQVLAQMPDIGLIILIGAYAQKYYLGSQYPGVTALLKNRKAVPKGFFPLVHPSPRNQGWFKQNPWFELEVVPELQHLVANLLK